MSCNNVLSSYGGGCMKEKKGSSIKLTGDIRSDLIRLSEDVDLPSVQVRARIILAFSNGMSIREVAKELAISPVTAGKWRSRFLRQ